MNEESLAEDMVARCVVKRSELAREGVQVQRKLRRSRRTTVLVKYSPR